MGHYQSNCKADKCCPRCSKAGYAGNCDKSQWTCINCGGSHSAAYHGCPKIREAITNATNTARIKSYAQAVTVKLVNNKKQLTDEIKTVEDKMRKMDFMGGYPS